MEILHPTHKSSSPEFGPSSVLGPGTCFKAYNLIQSQEAWPELKNECYKKLVKKFSLSLLLMTRSAELKLSALKKSSFLQNFQNRAFLTKDEAYCESSLASRATLPFTYYSGVRLKSYSKISEKHFNYFDHHPKRVQKQMIPHLKALVRKKLGVLSF